MNKLNVGDYVRTKKGMIAKIIDKKDISGSLHNEENVFILDNGNTLAINSIKVINSSPRIIDLIEVGDYVNGHRVVEVDLDDIDDYGNTFRYIKTEHDYSLNYWIKENEIETILTKESFENISYKVGE